MVESSLLPLNSILAELNQFWIMHLKWRKLKFSELWKGIYQRTSLKRQERCPYVYLARKIHPSYKILKKKLK